MIPIDTSQARQHVQDTHLNSQGMEALRAKGRDGDPEALREVARQFESMFVHQMLKQMRSTNEVFGEDSYFSSDETKFHEEMLDQQMSLELTKGRGLGLAEMLYEQMQSAYGAYLPQAKQENERDEAILPRDGAAAPAAGLQRQGQSQSANRADKTELGQTPEEFVRSLKPHATAAAETLGVRPEALVAQAALETGWGRHVIHDRGGNSSHNLFNIKADTRWSGDSVNVSTLEYRDGLPQMERADFRRYNDYQESFTDYVNFLQNNPRYREALAQGNDAERYVEALQEAGYATDPAYADKLKSLMRSDPFAGFASDATDSPWTSASSGSDPVRSSTDT